jgi:hypothetical protein
MTTLTAKTLKKKLVRRSFVVSLVRDRLGCGCPEEVFDHYEVKEGKFLSIPFIELVMGGRLLVWIIDGEGSSDLTSHGTQLLKEGRAERDRRGLNRFRLVWIGHSLDPSLESEMIKTAGGIDPKVHFHRLKSQEVF